MPHSGQGFFARLAARAATRSWWLEQNNFHPANSVAIPFAERIIEGCAGAKGTVIPSQTGRRRKNMRERMEELAREKRSIAVNFAAAPSGNKLVSINGTIATVSDDHMVVNDMYGNVMIIPFASIAYIEVKK